MEPFVKQESSKAKAQISKFDFEIKPIRLNLQGAGVLWLVHGRLEGTYRRGYAN
jgi:hypothetical protein